MAVAGSAAAARQVPRTADRALAAGGPGRARGLLSAGRAQALARATRRPVVASALTTTTSQTTANPDGTFTLTESVRPVRAWRHGRWAALDPTLRRDSNGTVSPALTTSQVALSGGGSGPLAVLATAGRTLTLSWPAGRLPAPGLSGPTAVYSNVLPGVDLDLTVDSQGDVTDVLVVKSASAAADPALASIKFGVSAPGLSVTADKAGNLRAAASGTAQPVFTAPAPRMWDSARPPSGARIAANSPGLPGYSSTAGPGAGAHTAPVAVSPGGKTITLSPAAAVLKGPGPVFIDPSWYPAGGGLSWSHEIASYSPGSTNVNTGGDLQVGLCDFSTCGNGNNWVARTLFAMTIPTVLRGAEIDKSNIWMTDVAADTCTTSGNSTQLWATGSAKSSTWNSKPNHQQEIEQENFAYQDPNAYPGTACPSSSKDVAWGSGTSATGGTSAGELATWVGHDANANPEVNTQSFELQAANEATDTQWKQFLRGAGNITMTTTYNLYPDQPSSLENAPGGGCHTNAASEAQIGNDDVTLSATIGDQDTDALTASLTVYSYATGQPVPGMPITFSTSGGTKSTTVSTTIPRTTIYTWQANGQTTAYRYYWKMTVTDANGLVSPVSDTCYFFYNPNGPATPEDSATPASVAAGSDTNLTITEPAGCSSNNTCPVSYTYQVGDQAPVTVTPNNNPSAGDWTGAVPVGQVGPVQVIVYDTTTAGSISGAFESTPVTGTTPANAYPDGYFTNGASPDVLDPGSGSKPSLWLATGSGPGTLNPATDIGSLGTDLSPGSGTDGPGDWSTGDSSHPLQVLHGDFTGNKVQDVIAYYPGGTFAGDGVLLYGDGTSASLRPYSGLSQTMGPQNWLDPSFGDGTTDDVPLDLVAAGNASQLGASQADLIGILPSSSPNPTSYELVLYSTAGSSACGGANAPGGYCAADQLSITAPGGGSDSWSNYTLASVQPGSYPGQAGNPSATMLFALNKTNGNLYEFKNPHCDDQDTSTCGTVTSQLAGMPGSTMTQLTVPWGSSPPASLSADYNHNGTIELWGLSGTSATPYTVSGTTVSAEGSGTTIGQGSDDWQLTDGNPVAQGSAATTATDSVTGNTASLNGTAGTNYFWNSDGWFRTALLLDGSTSYVIPPSGTIPSGDTSPTLSLWFQTATNGGVLASMQSQPLSSGQNLSSGYDPILYIGTDGKLYAEWWDGTTGPIASLAPVDDGLWHHVRLSGSGTTQTLTVDGVVQGTITGHSINLTGLPNLDFGAGYIGGGWPNEIYGGQTGTRDYVNGEIADITFSQ